MFVILFSGNRSRFQIKTWPLFQQNFHSFHFFSYFPSFWMTIRKSVFLKLNVLNSVCSTDTSDQTLLSLTPDSGLKIQFQFFEIRKQQINKPPANQQTTHQTNLRSEKNREEFENKKAPFSSQSFSADYDTQPPVCGYTLIGKSDALLSLSLHFEQICLRFSPRIPIESP